MRNADAVRLLAQDLQAIFGARLRSLVAYGVADSPADTPTATLALVDSVTVADLRACAARVGGWHASGVATPLVLEADEFDRSLDAFPLEFGAIVADHELVLGTSPFANSTVEASDLRRACEVQARSHLLHLREGYMEAEGRSDAVAALIARSAAPLAALLRHVGRMTGQTPDGEVLARVARIGPNGSISSDEARRIFPEYLDAVDRLTIELDRWTA